jgi:zinc transport system permease protein
MDLDALIDPLFQLAFFDGLLLAIVLPLLGTILLLRDEWLAALGFAQLSAAGALLAIAAGVPALLGGLAAAAAGAVAKGAGGAQGNSAYAFMILGGWAALLLIAANAGLGEQLGRALIEGQLYFAGPMELGATAALALLSAATLPWMMPRLLRARLLPHHDAANRLPAHRWHLGFDLLAAAAMAIATAGVGVMAAFALILAPAWIAFRSAPSWRWTLLLATAIGAIGYVTAFVTALRADQPFGPMLVAVMLACAGAYAILSRVLGKAPARRSRSVAR